jgi:hypothetical protein
MGVRRTAIVCYRKGKGHPPILYDYLLPVKWSIGGGGTFRPEGACNRLWILRYVAQA